MPRPRSVARAHDAPISNAEMARIFSEIGDMLEILGEVVYKAVAYRRVADAVERYPQDVALLFRNGSPPKLPGAGVALSAKLDELARTGHLEYHERLRGQVPSGLLEMLRVDGVGPRTARLLHQELGIDSLAALKTAAASGSLRTLRGLSQRTEQNILEAIGRLERPRDRLLIHDADRLVAGIVERLRTTPGVRRIEAAGSLRRGRSTIGDLDLLAAVDESSEIVATLDRLPEVERVFSAGADKSSILLRDGPRVDLMTCPPGAWGSHLVHFTGSAAHNVALRGRALDRGLSLSEHGFRVLETGGLLPATEEAEVYDRLGLAWIPPELREDEGEIEAASAGSLPALVTEQQMRGDMHVHSDWTDGVDTIDAMAQTARARGLEYLVLTDHSPGLGITRGLNAERVEAQRLEIDRLNAELAPFRILHGTEVEIRADGSLDYPDAVLARFDVVVASIHSARGQSPELLTRRALAAIENPHVDVLAHPTGRIVNRRDGVELDWPAIFTAAAGHRTLLEINGSHRMDLDDSLARAAGAAGAMVSVATDAHRTEELDQLPYAVGIARRAWLTSAQVANTRTADELLELVA